MRGLEGVEEAHNKGMRRRRENLPLRLDALHTVLAPRVALPHNLDGVQISGRLLGGEDLMNERRMRCGTFEQVAGRFLAARTTCPYAPREMGLRISKAEIET